MNEIAIHTEYIKLQQVLKLAGFLNQGSEVKIFLTEGKIKVNGIVATERGKKIRAGDVISMIDMGEVMVVAEEVEI